MSDQDALKNLLHSVLKKKGLKYIKSNSNMTNIIATLEKDGDSYYYVDANFNLIPVNAAMDEEQELKDFFRSYYNLCYSLQVIGAYDDPETERQELSEATMIEFVSSLTETERNLLDSGIVPLKLDFNSMDTVTMKGVIDKLDIAIKKIHYENEQKHALHIQTEIEL